MSNQDQPPNEREQKLQVPPMTVTMVTANEEKKNKLQWGSPHTTPPQQSTNREVKCQILGVELVLQNTNQEISGQILPLSTNLEVRGQILSSVQ